MLRYIILAALFTLGACESTHDLKRDGANVLGGGFIDEEIGPGLYLIKAFSNTSFFVTPESAAKTFEYRAKQLCSGGYEEIRVLTDAYNSMTPVPKISIPSRPGLNVEGLNQVITSKIGHVRCSDAPISYDEARALLSAEKH